MTTSPPLLEVRDLHFGYPLPGGARRSVLRGISLRVAAGETVALIGPNGSGKTTLLRAIAGTLAPASGDVIMDGTPIAGLRRAEVARRVAVLPQALELPAGFTVAQLVEMGRAPHARSLFGMTDADRAAVDRAIGDAGVADLRDRFTDQLSGGERQRVLIAMALAQEPDLLLLDEPTVHLDLGHQVSTLDSVRRLCRMREIGVLGVFHDLGLAAAYGDRVAALHEGRIAADGPPSEVLDPRLVQLVFGIDVHEALTAAGARHLVLAGPS